MDTTVKYNVVRFRPLLFGSYSHIQRIDSWEPKLVAKEIDLEKVRFFWFEERSQTTTTSSNPAVVLTVKCSIENQSGIYYVNSFIETFEDIKARKDSDEQRLLDLMQREKWNMIVRSIDPEQTWVHNFTEKDKLVDFQGNIVT